MKRVLLVAILTMSALACGGDTPVTVNPQTLPPGTVGQPYDVAMTGAQGNDGRPVILSVTLLKGSLPPGITTYQSPGDGTGSGGIRGTPTSAGTFDVTIELGGNCTMGGCVRGSRDYSLVVNP